MYLPTTHTAFSILGANLASIILRSPVSSKVVIWGIAFGLLPDIDYIYYLSRYGIRPAKYSHEHRQVLTHSFLPHLVVSIILFLVWSRLYSLIYLFAVLTHLILDSVHPPWGVRWLWPFSKKYYSLGIKSGLVTVTQEELDTFTKTRGDQPWIRRFVRVNNLYFIFEILTSLGFVGYLIYFFTK